MDIIDQLNEIGRRVNNAYPNINNGGCCVYAVLIAKQLQKLKIPCSIIIAGGDGSLNVVDARRNIKDVSDHVEWHRNGIWFNHVGVSFTYKGKRYHYDSEEGVHPMCGELMKYPLYKGYMRVKWAELLANEVAAWNSRFDRRKIPQLSRMVERFFDPTSLSHKRFVWRLKIRAWLETIKPVRLTLMELKMKLLGEQRTEVCPNPFGYSSAQREMAEESALTS